jgi:exopolysaccharide biosynthesis polyprenyl glycosylphosphotransferase
MGETPLSGSSLVLKRIIDLVGSSCLILVCAPFWCLLAVLVKLESKGPVFYSQERVGHDGRTISVLKFRSMREGAETETGPVWAVREDPRRTRLGAWMRKYNVDETPQFLNVFRGEMSLVGPRPERPHFVNQFKEDIPSYLKRHMVKSGITGWAQVNGLRGDTSIEERTRYDMWYIQNWSLLLDLRILAKTLFAHENAH